MASGLLRLALALIVVVHHLSRFGVGKACVYIFFALSGYWVARMWNEKYRACEQPWRTFVMARFLRIWPLFILTNIAAMAVFAAVGLPGDTSCHDGSVTECARALVGNGFILGYALLDTRAVAPAWSLDIELQFYIAAPLIIQLLSGRRHAFVSAAILVASVLACYYLPETLPQYLPFFALGVLSATKKVRIGRPMAWASAFSTAAMLLLLLLTETGRSVILTGANPGPLASYNDALNVLIAIVAAPGAVYLASQERGTRGAALGDIAFVVYIVHWIPITLVNVHWGSLPPLQRAPYVGATVLLTIVLSVLIWKLLDQPLERWRRSLAGSSRKRGGLRNVAH